MQLITTHVNADFDGLASMIAVQKLYPGATMAFSGSQERNVRAFIAQSLGYNYTFAKVKDIELDKVSKLILVDTRTSGRIGPFKQCLTNPGIEIHLYDHHLENGADIKGHLEVIENCGSTTTLLVNILKKKKTLISSQEATIFALGIYEDTGSFTHLTTTPKDLLAASWLVKQGAELDQISQFLTHELTSHQISILHELMKSAKQYTIQDIPIVVVTYSLDEYMDEFSLIVKRFMAMENLNVLFALISMGGRIYFIARSRIADVNVGTIARDLGGGGHATAASATIKEMTLIQAQEKLIHTLHRHIHPQPIASEMMSTPAITVNPELTIDAVKDVLTRYNITAAPVCADSDQKTQKSTAIQGIITRQIVEKAMHHNLGRRPVSDYMTSEVETLPLGATLGDIQRLIIENRQRIIPILADDNIVGIITRTDLLNRLVNDPAHLPKDLLSEADHPSLERTRNLTTVIVECLHKKMTTLLRTIGEVAQKRDYNAYAVGGFVRDLLLKKPNFDLDIVIEGDGILFAKALAAHLGGRYRKHERFKTAVVLMKNGFKIDIATARLEYYEYPAAMPTVELSSIKLDLSRRDFTINAMAIQLNPARFGTLIDFFNCQSDLKKKVIKVLHNLSFVEDPSRIFRAIRFEKRMGFQISPHTRRLINNAVTMKLFGKAADMRFLSELKIILSEENPLPALQRLSEFNLFQFLWPDLRPHYKVDRRYGHILIQAQMAISWHRLLYLDEPCQNWMVYLLTIMSRSPVDILLRFCKRFEETQKNTNYLRDQKILCDRAIHTLRRDRRMKNSEIVACLESIQIEGLLYMMAIARKNHVKKAISSYVTTLRELKPAVTGKDLIALGYTPGPRFKKILDYLKNCRLDGLAASSEQEILLVTKKFPR
ncbi:CBS domain-containing protein [Desulforhopalus singaporensis]|uniref:tRNA nucleotidyltransferase (CCA-adding enzyme) n=1 Tax=Desulforhopalus singaporensis TaxID=91360 RepID=A0A1H0M4K6_9BACT|nr:CBS domain-containing protein [Desulforhopalus singaporensis]SDO75314.1 tRNA nucleotidyltransferase (CCA-adding enzyme) [Desulforhopalus singaporensis]